MSFLASNRDRGHHDNKKCKILITNYIITLIGIIEPIKPAPQELSNIDIDFARNELACLF